MIYTLLIIFSLISIIAILPIISKEVKKFIFFICGIILVIVAGLRTAGIDRDSLAYIQMFNNTPTISVEPSFKLISSIIHFICGPDSLFLFFIYALLGITIKMIAIRQLTNLWFFSLVIYISFFYILQDLTQIRAGIATGMLLLCIKPLYNRDFRLFIIFSVIASLFHYSALIILPLWFLEPKKINITYYTLLIPIAYCLYFMEFQFSNLLNFIPIPDIQNKIQGYQTQNTSASNVFNIFQLIRCGVCLILLRYIDLIKAHNKYAPLMLKIYIWGIILFILLANIQAFSSRISEILIIVEIILIPQLYYTITSLKFAKAVPILIGSIFILIDLFYLKLIN